MVVYSLRNGFGFDVEVVNDMPVWAWTKEGADKDTDEPDGVADFEGMVFNLPFLKIMVGKIVGIYE